LEGVLEGSPSTPSFLALELAHEQQEAIVANTVYLPYKQSLLSADTNVSLNVNTATDGPFVALLPSTYTFSSAHQFYSSLTGIVGTDQQVSSPTVTNGTLDGNDLTYTAVSGAQVVALVLYRHNSGANTTWRLVFYEDTGVTGLPVTPNGGNITVTWNASGIFTISDARAKSGIRKIGHYGPLGVYDWRWPDGSRGRGFIAQEVAKVIPFAVRRERDVLRVNYPSLLGRAA
jgi:hypothetical protein